MRCLKMQDCHAQISNQQCEDTIIFSVLSKIDHNTLKGQRSHNSVFELCHWKSSVWTLNKKLDTLPPGVNVHHRGVVGLLVGPTGVPRSGLNVNTENVSPMRQMNVKTAPQVSNPAHEQYDAAQWGSNLQVKTEETKGSDGIQLVRLYTCEKQQDVQSMCGLYTVCIISAARVANDRGMWSFVSLSFDTTN